MKKRLVLLLALTIILACLVASCGSKEIKDDNNISPSQDVEEEDAPAEYPQENEGEQSEEGETPEQEGSSEDGEAAVTSIDDIPWNDSDDAVSFVVRIKDSPKGWNPNVHGDDNLFLIAQNVYPRLCALDTTKSNLVGEAAQSWEFNQDATELTFHLRDGLTWTNGKPLTSEDVKYTFETIKNNRDYPFSVIMENVEIAYYLTKFLLESYRKNLCERYKIEENYIEKVLNQDQMENENIYEIMLEIGRKRGAIISGGNVDEEKTSRIIIDDFRNQKLGKITLELCKE